MSDHQANVAVKMGSERGFGFVFCAVFLLVGVWPILGGGLLRWWALAIAAILLAITLMAPHLLRPLNRLWFRLGILLGAVIAPIVMALVYFVAFLPIGLILHAMGKDILKTRRQPELDSYWLERDQPPGSMRRQF